MEKIPDMLILGCSYCLYIEPQEITMRREFNGSLEISSWDIKDFPEDFVHKLREQNLLRFDTRFDNGDIALKELIKESTPRFNENFLYIDSLVNHSIDMSCVIDGDEGIINGILNFIKKYQSKNIKVFLKNKMLQKIINANDTWNKILGYTVVDNKIITPTHELLFIIYEYMEDNQLTFKEYDL